MRTLLLDNYDSYTFNLYQLLAEVNGQEPLVVRNDQLRWFDILSLAFDNVVISPGPGRPDNHRDFGVCTEVLRHADVPLLGVCLGHQGLAHAYGAAVVRAAEVMHGRRSAIHHDGSALFEGIPQGFQAVRYHSLVVEGRLPDCLVKTAWTEQGTIMALRHRERPLWGVQFHPESICTEHGRRLLWNFHDITRRLGFGTGARRTRHAIPDELNDWGPRPPSHPTRFDVRVRRLDVFHEPELVFAGLLGREPFAFWLDSSRVEPGLSRFSFMGAPTGPLSQVLRYRTDPRELRVTRAGSTIRRTESIFEYLDGELARMRIAATGAPFDLTCGFVGYLGYELKAECGSPLVHRSPVPDAYFIFADQIVVFDHAENTTYLACLVPRSDRNAADAWFEITTRQLDQIPCVEVTAARTPVLGQGTGEFRLSRSYETYLGDIRECQRRLRDGDTYEVCLTNRITADPVPDPLALYRVLRAINPAPYGAFLRFGDLAVLSSSPERFLRIDGQGRAEAKPIKGTRPRGKTPEEDALLRDELRNSEKDRAENLMVVDLVRNQLGTVCRVGSVHVPNLMDVETYQTVHQLVSTIAGTLRQGVGAVDCIRAAFPGGSMTGAPQLRTMEIIDELETEARGVYSGAIGYLGLNGTADLGIAIRTIVVTPDSASIGAGGAILAQSIPEDEFDEMLLKARAPMDAIVLSAHGHTSPARYRIIGDRASEP